MVQDAFGLVVRFTLLAGHEAAFDALVSETVPEIQAKEPGTPAYLTHSVAGEPSIRVFYELYRDRAALDAHEETAHGRRFLAEREAHLAGPPEVWWVSGQAGHARGLSADGDG